MRRVAKVIEEEFGVSYHKSHVSRLLKELGWTPQMPIARAIQRDEQEIERWRAEAWPRLKAQACRERRALVFVDESGFYLLPGRVKTYAPEGHTPILHEWQTRDHLSVMGGVTPTGRIYVLVRQISLNGLHTIEFLRHLIHHIGSRLLVIWDGSPIHRRAEGQGFPGECRGAGVCTSSDCRRSPPTQPGRGRLGAPEACRAAQYGVPGLGRTSPGTPSCHRPPETKAAFDPVVLRGCRTAN